MSGFSGGFHPHAAMQRRPGQTLRLSLWADKDCIHKAEMRETCSAVGTRFFAWRKGNGHAHDELIIDCLKTEVDEVRPLLKEIMENTVSLRVPLTVDMKAGDDWYHMEKM